MASRMTLERKTMGQGATVETAPAGAAPGIGEDGEFGLTLPFLRRLAEICGEDPVSLGDRRVRNLTTREVGVLGEALACQYLRLMDYEIVDSNWETSFGEVDIVARHGATHVLVEVKARATLPGRADPIPELAVDARKRGRYRRMAEVYLALHPEVAQVRFDVVAICFEEGGDGLLRHLRNAFGCDE